MRRRFTKIISSILLAGMLMVSGSVAFAVDGWKDAVADNTIDQKYAKDNIDIIKDYDDTPQSLKDKLTQIDKKYGVVGDARSPADTDKVESWKNEKAGAIVAAAQKQSAKDKVDDMASTINVGADTGAAGTALSGVEDLIQLVVGVLCYAITLGMTLFTSIDLCYITMPVFRNKCEEVKQSGNGALTKTNAKTGETQVRFVTDEALYAVQSCSIESGKQPLTVYLKKRVWAFVMLAVVLFILFTGNIQLIVDIAINFVSGVMNALSGLAG